jgi:UDP-N-acetyl-2-amino-2-deoxyglucuronate dehydrogenase
MSDRFGVGIIGLGMGYRHLEATMASPDARLVSICDIDPVRLQQVKSETGVEQAVSSFEELLRNPDVDIVVVASPDHFHCEHTVAALQAGKHVLVEKPMAPTIQACQEMVDAARTAGRQLAVGHVVRFTPAFSAIKHLADIGELGTVYYVGTSYEHDYERLKRQAAWRFDPKYARHQFLGGGCHAVDLLRHFVPDIESTSAVANHFSLPQSPNDDCLVALYRSASGPIGRVLVTAGCKRPYEIALEVYGTQGTVLANNTSTSMRYWTLGMQGLGDRWIDVPVTLDNHPVDIQFAHFIAAIRGETELLVSGEEGMRTVALALASIRASHTDTWQNVDTPALSAR